MTAERTEVRTTAPRVPPTAGFPKRYDVAGARFDTGYPRPIGPNWPGFPAHWTNVDTAAVLPDGALHLFRGDEYIRFDATTLRAEDGIVRDLAVGFPGVSGTAMHAALVYPSSGRVYFFGDDAYVRFDTSLDRVDTGYPRPIVGYWSGALF